MKRLLFFICLGCGTANAATMCVPDLSTCESCSEVSYDHTGKWEADCCGVRVSGVAFYTSYRSGMTNSLDVSLALAPDPSADKKVVSVCLMTRPVVAHYFYLVKNRSCCIYFSPGMDFPVYNDGSATVASQNCASAFKPVCALSRCSDILNCDGSCQGVNMGGGAD
ncbi:MAG: hypothetical protein R8M37_03385 [Alphaproteobacteria bacterium]|nr:hypothetical protein [Alphaproteobacteria bacterium]